MKWLALLTTLTACSDLEAIEIGVCGNGVLELGEDCDGSPSCIECGISCGGTDECPDGFACGADGFCHAPGGVLHAVKTVPFSVSEYTVTDANHDRIGDVVGLTSTTVTVRLGDALTDALLETDYSTLTPKGRGQPSFTRLDDDTSTDVVLATDDGLVGFTSHHGVLAPHPFAFNPGGPDGEGPGGGPMIVFALDLGHVGFFQAPATGTGLAISLVDVQMGTQPSMQEELACTNLTPSDDILYNTYSLPPIGTDARIIVALVDPAKNVCAFLVRVPATGPFTVTSIVEANIPTATQPVLADLGGIGCPSLVIAPNQELRASRDTSSNCVLASTLTVLPPQVGIAVGRVSLEPPIASYASEALVTTSGVYAITPTRSAALDLYTDTTRTFTHAASGDIDGNGTIDAVVITADEGVDVLLRVPAPAFLLFRIATAGPTTNLNVGDYDGNFVGDIVYTEQVQGGERLMVAYGTRDRPLASLQVGMYSRIVSFLPVQIPDSIDPTATLVQDLAIVDEPIPDRPLLTILHGSPQRTMVSYFSPRDAALVQDTTLTGSVGGQFLLTGGTVDPTDMLTFEWVGPGANMHLSIGSGAGALQQMTSMTSGMPDELYFRVNVVNAEPMGTSTNQFCLAEARYVSVPRSPADLVIGVDRSREPTSIVIDPMQLKTNLQQTTPNVVPPAPGLDVVGDGLEIRALRTADLDGNGIPDVLAAYAPTSDRAGEIRACMNLDFSTCPDLAATALGGASCRDVAPARVVPRGRHDPEAVTARMPLVALCDRDGERALWRITHDGSSFSGERLVGVPPTIEMIEIGDVNGDAVDDVLALDRDDAAVVRQLVVFLQCTARDRSCREGE